MVAANLLPAIREAIKQNEIGNGSPYVLSFARLGSSGASFGIFQGDTNVNPLARDTLAQILHAQHADPIAVTRIIVELSRPCPNGNPLSASDTNLVNSALSSGAGRVAVDQMDSVLLNIVLGELDTCITAAASVNKTLAPIVQLYIALWVNMTGAPHTLNRWLTGTTVSGVAPPAGPVVTLDDIAAYLRASTYFKLHPRNFIHMSDSVGAGAQLLPAA